MTTERRIVVVSSGLREPSSTRLLADRLAGAARDALERVGVVADVEVVDVREYAHDVVNALVAGFPSARFAGVVRSVAEADGLIAVTPIFNASYSGLFKAFVDVLPEDALAGTPVLLAATGGTARHSLALEHALRPLFAYLQALVVPTAVFAAPEDWGGTAEESLHGRIRRATEELADHVARREPTVATDPFALPASFDELLARD